MSTKGEQSVPLAETPQIAPLEPSKLFVSLSRPLAFQQSHGGLDVACLPSLVRQAHLGRVEMMTQRPLPRLGSLLLLLRVTARLVCTVGEANCNEGENSDHRHDHGEHSGGAEHPPSERHIERVERWKVRRQPGRQRLKDLLCIRETAEPVRPERAESQILR
jgi:hypothetical protein